MVEHNGAFRYLDLEVAATCAVTIATAAMTSTLTLAMGVIAKGEQRRHVAIGNKPNRTPVPPVATIGASLRNVGLTSKRDATSTTITALEVDAALVDEVGHACKATQSPVAPR